MTIVKDFSSWRARLALVDERPIDARMRGAVAAVEVLLGYRFRKPKLLVDALTHSSFPESASYERLEFVGDAVLGLAITNHLYLANPDLDPGKLSLLRAANISTEKLARVAVRRNLYQYVRRNAPSLDEKVKEFAASIEGEADEVPYTGISKAPKVLADVVEGIAAAVYVDCDFNLKQLWLFFRGLLEPIVTLETLQLQPVTTLFEFCQKHGRQLDIKFWKKGLKNIASVCVDGKLLGSGSSEQKDLAKLYAVKEALQSLADSNELDFELDDSEATIIDDKEGGKKRLNEFCTKIRWPKPCYRVENELGPTHEKRFACSVQVDTTSGVFISTGNVKSRVRDAENSAAYIMLNFLLEMKHKRTAEYPF